MSESRPERPPWATFREALERAGFRPSRRLGQNFLLDDNMARAIAADAGVTPGRFVLEVGPGCGFLSVHLAHAGARLLCVEVDPRLAPIAAEFLRPYPAAEVMELDVLGSKSAIAPEVLARLPGPGEPPWTVAANLPYSISGPFLAALSRLEHPPETVVCLVQREVAERLAGAPGTAAWGPLSAGFGEAYTTRLGRSVPPSLFWPRPKVDSAVFVARLRDDLAPAELRRERVDLYRRLLARRRQSLGRVLREIAGAEAADAALDAIGVERSVRAETLGVDQLRALHAALAGAC